MARKLHPISQLLAQTGLVGCLLMTFGAGHVVEAKGPEHRKPDYRRQILELEELWRTAQISGDIAAMDKLLSEDYVGITMNGQVVTKMQQLDRIRSRQVEVTKIQLSDVKVKLISNTAIVTSQADVEGTGDGAPLHGTYRYTRVYTRLPSGSWKITNFEATRVGPRQRGGSQNNAQTPTGSR